MEVSGSRPSGPRRFPPSLQRALWAPPPHGPAASPGRSLSCSRRRRRRHRLRGRKPGRSLWLLDCTGRLGIAMQLEEVGLVPAPAREPRLTRWLRRGSGILAHLIALGFTIFLIVLSRPGTSECARRGGAVEGAEPRRWGGGPLWARWETRNLDPRRRRGGS